MLFRSKSDWITEKIRACADNWRTPGNLDDQGVARMMRQDRLDILVNLNLHMSGNRLMVFAAKPAAVQVCWIGYPGSTGLETVDWRLSDPRLDPPGNDANYVERTFRLPDTFWCYDPLEAALEPWNAPFEKSGQITFGCLNNFFKVNDPVVRLWGAILRQVEGSRLIVQAPVGSARQRLADLLAAAGIATERIQFVGKIPRLEYLAMYRQIDIALDTYPYNGHTTSLDALWMGTPVISRFGEPVVS